MFLKPDEESSVQVNNFWQRSSQGNWKKKNKIIDTDLEEKEIVTNSSDKSESEKNKVVTNDELNKLGAKILKAEILGNTELVEKLKAQLEEAKLAKSNQDPRKSGNERKEVVVLTDTQYTKKYSNKCDPPPTKRQKLSMQEAMNDKHSLSNLVGFDSKFFFHNYLKTFFHFLKFLNLQFVMEKEETKADYVAPSRLKVNNLDELDDVYLDATTSKKFIEKNEKKKEKMKMQEALKKHKTLEGCNMCLDNRNDTKHLIVSTGNKCYLCLPQFESLTTGHCIIVPIQHEASSRKLDEDIWEELKTYQQCLTKMFSEKGMDTIFFESARSFNHFPHCYIQCVPLEKEICDLAPIYFQVKFNFKICI